MESTHKLPYIQVISSLFSGWTRINLYGLTSCWSYSFWRSRYYSGSLFWNILLYHCWYIACILPIFPSVPPPDGTQIKQNWGGKNIWFPTVHFPEVTYILDFLKWLRAGRTILTKSTSWWQYYINASMLTLCPWTSQYWEHTTANAQTPPPPHFVYSNNHKLVMLEQS